MRTYRTILADPPWPYKGTGPRSTKEHRPNSHDRDTGCVSSRLRYGAMSLDEIIRLTTRLDPHVADNAHLYLWATNSFVEHAHAVARAWGFSPKTIITWVKIKPDGTPSMKTGYYYRGATEHLLFAVRGSLRCHGTAHPTAILSRRLPHSVKPEESYSMIVCHSFGPFLELFARKNRPGWDAWGNEVENDVEL